MAEIENKDTRYFIDLDLENMKIIRWGSGQMQKLINEKLPSNQVRIFITKGQFKKLG